MAYELNCTAEPVALVNKAHHLPRQTVLVWIILTSLITLGGTIAVLAIGGRPDPPALRAVAPLLGGPWRFHTGDDPHWASPDADDSNWETIDLSAPANSHDGDVGLPNFISGWMAHGHPGYHGYAWYRLSVAVPPGNRRWKILGPTAVDHAYEMYWNGVLLGGSGRLGVSPRVVGTRPMMFALPADAAGSRGVLAIRVFMLPGGGSPDAGGIHVAPTLAPDPEGRELYRVEWWRTIAGYIVEVIEPLAMFGVIALALATLSHSSRRVFIRFACVALVFSAAKRLDNAIVAWTDLLSLPAYAWLSSVLWMPLSLAAWALAWNRWRSRASRVVDIAGIVLAVMGIFGAAAHVAPIIRFHRYGFLVLFVLIAARMVGQGIMRIMALATMFWVLVAQFAGELSSIGVPGIWFPFGIGVSRTQYAYAIALPLLALLIVRTTAEMTAQSSRG